ncbi:MAG: TonB-dependent receptor [Gammaproteobacteria bacterium]|nr:TonB-dependent receptor [Gammaproteobacteria bacterium]
MTVSSTHPPAWLRARSTWLISGSLVATLVGQGAFAQSESSKSPPTQHSAAEPGGSSVETIVVTANGSQVELPADYAGGQIARGGRIGMFGNLDLMDTPFNATNFTAEFIRDSQASSLADVVQSDPGVRVARGFGNFQELYVVRGFPVYSDDMSYNGLYGLLPRQYVAAEFLERVEVFRGANTFLNGAAPGGSGIGGSFNLVPKRAPDQDINRLTVGFENQSQGYGAADFSRRFGADHEFGVRVNGVRRDGDDSVDHENRKLSMASLGADFRGEHARVSVDLGWQDHHIDSPRPSVTPSGAIPQPPDPSKNFAQPWSFTEEHDFFGVARGEYDFNEDAKVWAATGVRKGTEHNILSNPTADALGNTSSYRFDNYRKDLITTSEIGVRGAFHTGGVGHRVSLSGSIFQLNSKNAYAFSSFFPGFVSSLYNPIDVPPPTADFFVGGVLLSPLTTNRVKTASAAIADMLSFAHDRVLLTLGAREQKMQQYSYDYNTGIQNSGYDKSAVTPVAGLVVKPTKQISVYANYIEGLIQGAVAPNVVGATPVANAGEVFSPFKSKQEEVGVKYDRGRVGGTLAIFRITEPQAILAGNVYGVDGQQRNQGAELSWYGELAPGVRVLGGVTELDAKTTRTQSGLLDGKKVIGVPDTQANLGLEWDVAQLHGLTFDGRVVYTGSQPTDAGNTQSIPAWTRLDLGARYAMSVWDRLLTVRANIDNVTDKAYWASVGGAPGANYLVLGAPRTFIVSVSADL